jgi:hypothetical protein
MSSHFYVKNSKGMMTMLDRDEELKLLADKDVRGINQAVLGFFSTLLGLVVGATVASQYPSDYAFAGFWLTGFILSVIFYLPLQRWHRNLKWQLERTNPA